MKNNTIKSIRVATKAFPIKVGDIVHTADMFSGGITGEVLEYCSAECIEHLQDEHQEYLDSL